MQKTSALAEFIGFQKAHKAIAAIVWIAAAIAGLIFALPSRASDLFPMIAMTGALGGLAITLLARYDAILTKRVNGSDTGPDWSVRVNGVTVGTVSDATYAEIRRDIFFDPRVYAAQLMNMGAILNRVVDYLFLAIPLGVFWAAVACYFFAPATFAETVASLQKVTPAEAGAALGSVVRLFGVLSVMVIGVHFALGRRFGFVNHFDEACADRLRRKTNCPAEGRVDLYRIVDGTHFQSNEMDFMRKR